MSKLVVCTKDCNDTALKDVPVPIPNWEENEILEVRSAQLRALHWLPAKTRKGYRQGHPSRWHCPGLLPQLPW